MKIVAIKVSFSLILLCAVFSIQASAAGPEAYVAVSEYKLEYFENGECKKSTDRAAAILFASADEMMRIKAGQRVAIITREGEVELGTLTSPEAKEKCRKPMPGSHEFMVMVNLDNPKAIDKLTDDELTPRLAFVGPSPTKSQVGKTKSIVLPEAVAAKVESYSTEKLNVSRPKKGTLLSLPDGKTEYLIVTAHTSPKGISRENLSDRDIGGASSFWAKSGETWKLMERLDDSAIDVFSVTSMGNGADFELGMMVDEGSRRSYQWRRYDRNFKLIDKRVVFQGEGC